MKVLSLFDGIAVGRLALKEAKVPVTRYYASEINPRATSVALRNHGEIIQLGAVQSLRKNSVWERSVAPSIDVLIGGSPCQGFSRSGDELAFDDPRSVLFFEYVKVLESIRKHNPDVLFFLENVRMAQKHVDVITDLLGVEPYLIDSAIHAPAHRKRYYWTNITHNGKRIPDPTYVPCSFDDIVEEGIAWHPYKTADLTNRPAVLGNKDKLKCLTRTFHNGDRCLITDGHGSFRNPTTLEGERALGLPDGYTAGIDETHRWFVIGDSWCLPTIVHFFKYLKPQPVGQYGTLTKRP